MMNSHYTAAAAACISVLLPLSANAQVKKQGAGYLLRMKYKPGTVRKYSIVTSIVGLPAGTAGAAGGPMKISATVEQKVLSVAGKVAKVEVKTSAFQMANGTSVGAPQTVNSSIDELGDSTGYGKASGFGVHFPKEPIKVGGTWSRENAIPGMMGGATKAKTTYKFNGIKRVGKLSVADVSFNIDPSGMMKGGSGHSYLNPTDGSLSSVSMKFTVANPQGGTDLVTTVSIQPAK